MKVEKKIFRQMIMLNNGLYKSTEKRLENTPLV